jgi:hypothetical protein
MADKPSQAGMPTRQVARLIEVPTLTANIFVAAINRTNIHKQDRQKAPLISLLNEMSRVKQFKDPLRIKVLLAKLFEILD